MVMRRSFRRVLLCAVISAAAMGLQPAQAQRHDFHGRDFGGFSSGERQMWRGGQWQQGWHDNRYAWWWIVNGGWYLYPVPVYPYPTYVPPAIIVQRAPPVPTGLPPAQSWYYCDNPQGYYPYVAACNGPWRPVPVTPPK